MSEKMSAEETLAGLERMAGVMREKWADYGVDVLASARAHIATLQAEADALREALDRRIEGLLEWLEENAPECFDEQLHTVEGTSERVYWHYGYMVALRDVAALLTATPEQSDA